MFKAVLSEAAEHDIRIDRISQGSGIMMLTDTEIREMVRLGAEHHIEVNLFLGPRGGWDIGAQAATTGSAAGVARGSQAVEACVAEAGRAVGLGIRSLLVADLGVLSVLGELKAAGELPAELALKTSVLLPLPNASTGAVYERLGATSLNASTDLTTAQLAQLRTACTAALDVYVEVPDDQGGFVRYYDVPEIVREAAPVHLKLGVRNAPNLYPCGRHLLALATDLGRERVRRAALMLRLLTELAPELAERPDPVTPPADLAVPAP
ncbi:hypothetical protein [Halopolyspora algeriensis]|uniref:hypothetical protein n=1 Tax=Halopolyspora algeriensis TaxID=1500506 RepID=UPI00114D8651|nr:hypothetical protein [Halopolyspora algeriensis]